MFPSFLHYAPLAASVFGVPKVLKEGYSYLGIALNAFEIFSNI